MDTDRKWNITKFLIIPGIVFLVMSNEVNKKDNQMRTLQFQHQVDATRNVNEHIFRELDYKLDEIFRMIDGMHHELDMLRQEMEIHEHDLIPDMPILDVRG
jgi:hypothetical protein